MNILDSKAFKKIITLKSNKVLELKQVVATLDDENHLGYHDTTIVDLKRRSIQLEDLIETLHQAKAEDKSIDTIRKLAYKKQDHPYLDEKSPDVFYTDYLKLLESCERMTLDFLKYKMYFGNLPEDIKKENSNHPVT